MSDKDHQVEKNMGQDFEAELAALKRVKEKKMAPIEEEYYEAERALRKRFLAHLMETRTEFEITCVSFFYDNGSDFLHLDYSGRAVVSESDGKKYVAFRGQTYELLKPYVGHEGTVASLIVKGSDWNLKLYTLIPMPGVELRDAQERTRNNIERSAFWKYDDAPHL